MQDKFKNSVGDSIMNIRGLGMEIGIELKDEEIARKVIDSAFKKGLHVIIGSGSNLQIMPPLTISQKVLEEGMEILISSIKNALLLKEG